MEGAPRARAPARFRRRDRSYRHDASISVLPIWELPVTYIPEPGATASGLALGAGMNGLLAADELPAVEVREGQGPFVVVCEHASNRLPRAPRQPRPRPGRPRSSHRVGSRRAGSRGGHGAPAGRRPRRAALFAPCDRLQSRARPRRCHRGAVRGHAHSRQRRLVGGGACGARRRNLAAVSRRARAISSRGASRRASRRRSSPSIPSRRFIAASRGRGTSASSRPTTVGSPTGCSPGSGASPALVVGDNEPYSAKDNVDYTIRRHGRDRGLPHVDDRGAERSFADGRRPRRVGGAAGGHP